MPCGIGRKDLHNEIQKRTRDKAAAGGSHSPTRMRSTVSRSQTAPVLVLSAYQCPGARLARGPAVLASGRYQYFLDLAGLWGVRPAGCLLCLAPRVPNLSQLQEKHHLGSRHSLPYVRRSARARALQMQAHEAILVL